MLLADSAEASKDAGDATRPLSGRVHDLTPTEVKVVRDYFDRIRSAM
jgi:hypothetical protein